MISGSFTVVLSSYLRVYLFHSFHEFFFLFYWHLKIIIFYYVMLYSFAKNIYSSSHIFQDTLIYNHLCVTKPESIFSSLCFFFYSLNSFILICFIYLLFVNCCCLYHFVFIFFVYFSWIYLIWFLLALWKYFIILFCQTFGSIFNQKLAVFFFYFTLANEQNDCCIWILNSCVSPFHFFHIHFLFRIKLLPIVLCVRLQSSLFISYTRILVVIVIFIFFLILFACVTYCCQSTYISFRIN